MERNFRAAIGFENLVDNGRTLLRASTSAPFLSVQNLAGVHVGRKWRGLGNGDDSIYVDLQDLTAVDTVCFVGCPVSANTRVRIRGSRTRPEMDQEVIFERELSGFDPTYAYVPLLFEEEVVRYLRIDFLDPTGKPIEAGRLFVGKRWQYQSNFSYGWGLSWVDPSVRTKSYGGATFVDRKRKYRVGEFQFGEIKEEDRWGFIERVEIVAGTSNDVLFIIRPDADDIHRRVLWGVITQASPAVEQFFQRFGKQYQIEERL